MSEVFQTRSQIKNSHQYDASSMLINITEIHRKFIRASFSVIGWHVQVMLEINNMIPLQEHVTTTGNCCSVCLRTFSFRTSLSRHYRHKHREPGRVKCPLCDKTYVWRSELARHGAQVHKLPQDFQCTICLKYFKQEIRLRIHINKMHPQF